MLGNETLFRAKEAFYHKCVLRLIHTLIGIFSEVMPPFKILNAFRGIYGIIQELVIKKQIAEVHVSAFLYEGAALGSSPFLVFHW